MSALGAEEGRPIIRITIWSALFSVICNLDVEYASPKQLLVPYCLQLASSKHKLAYKV